MSGDKAKLRIFTLQNSWLNIGDEWPEGTNMSCSDSHPSFHPLEGKGRKTLRRSLLLRLVLWAQKCLDLSESQVRNWHRDIAEESVNKSVFGRYPLVWVIIQHLRK